VDQAELHAMCSGIQWRQGSFVSAETLGELLRISSIPFEDLSDKTRRRSTFKARIESTRLSILNMDFEHQIVGSKAEKETNCTEKLQPERTGTEIKVVFH